MSDSERVWTREEYEKEQKERQRKIKGDMGKCNHSWTMFKKGEAIQIKEVGKYGVLTKTEWLSQQDKCIHCGTTEPEYEHTYYDGGCFIATACYGSPLSYQLDTLRNFRDYFIQSNSIGKQLVNLYYAISPPIADYIRIHNHLKLFLRILLDVIITKIEGKWNLKR